MTQHETHALCLTAPLLVIFALTFTTACQTQRERAPQAQDLAAPSDDNVGPQAQHAYSPYLVRVKADHMPFDVISFKDVGLDVGDDTSLTYETIAESLALQMSVEPTLSSEVVYSKDILDPANHKTCGSRHIYVDVWSTQEPQQWGYSLWSGCGEEDRFAWHQLPRPHSEDPVVAVEALTRSIADALRDASARSCFTRGC